MRLIVVMNYKYIAVDNTNGDAHYNTNTTLLTAIKIRIMTTKSSQRSNRNKKPTIRKGESSSDSPPLQTIELNKPSGS